MHVQKGRSTVGYLVATLAMTSALTLPASPGRAEEAFKVGGVLSLTGGGAPIGKTAEMGWKLAIEDINAAGGVLGRKAELVLGDTMTDPTHGVSEARRLIENEKVQILPGIKDTFTVVTFRAF